MKVATNAPARDEIDHAIVRDRNVGSGPCGRLHFAKSLIRVFLRTRMKYECDVLFLLSAPSLVVSAGGKGGPEKIVPQV
jgi:hypothetical protein